MASIFTSNGREFTPGTMTMKEYRDLTVQMSDNLKMIENKIHDALGDLFEPLMQEIIQEAENSEYNSDGDIGATLLLMSEQVDGIDHLMTLSALSFYFDRHTRVEKTLH